MTCAEKSARKVGFRRIPIMALTLARPGTAVKATMRFHITVNCQRRSQSRARLWHDFIIRQRGFPMTKTGLTRRHVLASAAALPLAAATTGAARAAAPMMGVASTRFNRVTLGNFEVTTILAGTRTVPDPQNIFGMNVSADAFADASQAAHIPTDAAQFFFTPTVVNTGSELVLFDTGLNAEATTAALEQAGYTADQIDVVVITHMHGDHIGGLMAGDAPTFRNAGYVTGAQEFDAWAAMDNDGFESKVRPLAEQMTMLDDGGSVASGITAMAAFGHTPGQNTLMPRNRGKPPPLPAHFPKHHLLATGYSRLGSEVRHGQNRRRQN